MVGSPESDVPSGFTVASQFGAIGDGQQDDTEELQTALDKSRLVWLKTNGVYRISRRLILREKRELASDGTATVLLASGGFGFSNTSTDRNESGLYGPSGTGLLLEGSEITLRDVYIVKQYEDDRYVIGVEVRSAAAVLVNRVRLRGFSLAPGIITIRRGSKNVTVSNSLIHASCSESTAPPVGEKSSFQITGVLVDDSPLIPPASESIKITNNVIVDLFMKPVSYRGDQTDGINFGGIRTGDNSRIENNFIDRVSEGIDLFGTKIIVTNNTIGGRDHAVKLIHGARDIQILNNHLTGRPSISSVGIFTGYDQAERQVQNIYLVRNIIDMLYTLKPGVHVDGTGMYHPINIFIDGNRFLVTACTLEAVECKVASIVLCKRSSVVFGLAAFI